MTKVRAHFSSFPFCNFLSVLTIMGCSLGLESPAFAQAVYNGNPSSSASGAAIQGAPPFSTPFAPTPSPAYGQAPARSPEADGNSAASTTTPTGNVRAVPPFSTSVMLGQTPAFSAVRTPPSSAAGRTLFVVPSIGIEEDVTNANFSKPADHSVGLVTTITPGLLIEGHGPNADDIILNYQPRINLYTDQGNQNQFDQFLNAAGDLTLIPSDLNLATRAYVTQQATSGGVNPGGTTLLARGNTTTTQSYSISPNYLHSFYGAGTLNLNYLLSYTRQTGNTAFLATSANPYFNASNLTAQTETASFHTVPFFDRFDDIISSSTTQDISTGILNDAHQFFFSDTLRYVLIRHLILSGSGGYEDLTYSGIPPTTVHDATWNVGVELQPSAASDIIFRYQHLYGFNAPFLQTTYALTARTLLSANYSQFLGTQQQAIGSAVSGSSVNSAGLTVNSVSGAPILVSNQLLAQQSNLMRQSVFSLSATTTWTRDSLSLSLLHDQQKLIAIVPGFTGFSQNSASASITYTHALRRDLQFTAYFDDGTLYSEVASQKTTNRYSGMMALNYALNRTLTTYAQLVLQNQSLIDINNTQLQYNLIFGLNKSF
ncbi:MAG TPA: hypothetical protein VL356_03140 [Acidocella sp.]|nr:hypothetical protein [Acidocella sp.]